VDRFPGVGFIPALFGSPFRLVGTPRLTGRAGLSPRIFRNYRVPDPPLGALTDRQRDVLETAFESGYDDVPRRVSTAELAAALDIDDSTVSEHLQRAERNLIAAVLNRPG